MYAILYTVLGLALGLLFRGVPTALVILLAFPLVVEGLIIGLSNVPALGLADTGGEIPAVHRRRADDGAGTPRRRRRLPRLRLLQPAGLRQDIRDLRRGHPRCGLAAVPKKDA